MTPDTTAEKDQLEHFLKDYGPCLRRKIARTCPRHLGIDPLDIEQEVRLRLWRVLARRTRIENPASYLYRVVSSVTIDAVRRAKVRHEEPLRHTGQESEDLHLQAWAPAPEQQAENSQLLQKVECALGRLPEDSRRAIGLHLQGFTSQEIARLLGWTEPRARHLAHRGLHALRRRLGAER